MPGLVIDFFALLGDLSKFDAISPDHGIKLSGESFLVKRVENIQAACPQGRIDKH